MARPIGAQNKDKPFRDALRMEAVAGEDDTPLPKRSLRALARKLLDEGANGDISAIREVADRLDGKVPQAVATIDEDENLVPLVPIINLSGKPQES